MMSRPATAAPWVIAAAAVACLVVMALRMQELRTEARDLEVRLERAEATARRVREIEAEVARRAEEAIWQRLAEGGGEVGDAEVRRREEEARKREERRWVEGLKAKARAWLDRESARLSMGAGQVDEAWRVVEAFAEQLDGIRRGSGERDVERLIHDLYEEGDAEVGAALTAEQREKFGGLPRAWAEEVTSGMAPK